MIIGSADDSAIVSIFSLGYFLCIKAKAKSENKSLSETISNAFTLPGRNLRKSIKVYVY